MTLILFILLGSMLATALCEDVDGDGYGAYGEDSCTYLGVDCDDEDYETNPGADEIVGDHIDNNCDGIIDEIVICGDGICYPDEETPENCPDDCGDNLLDDGQGDGGDEEISTCYILYASWFDSDYDGLEYAYEGESVKLMAEIDNFDGDVALCNGTTINFTIVEIDFDEDEYGDPILVGEPELVRTFEVEVSEGFAEVEWKALYEADEDDDPITGADPDYVVFASLLNADGEIYNESEPDSFLIVMQEGSLPDEDIDTSLDTSDDSPEIINYADDYDYPEAEGGISASKKEYQQDHSIENFCGDGICDDSENLESCPEDCFEEEGGSFFAVIFFIIIISVALGAVGFFVIKKEFKAKKDLQNRQPLNQNLSQAIPPSESSAPQQDLQPPKSMQQPQEMQPSTAMQPTDQPPKLESPFANPQQLKMIIGYIKEEQAKGISDALIKELLKQNDYTDAQINYAFANL